MKAATIAGLLAFLASQLLALFEPLRAALAIFAPWQRVFIVGGWCALVGAVTLLGGRDTARRKGWSSELCITMIGILAALMHFPSARFPPAPFVPREYIFGVLMLAACWLPAALIAH